MADAAGVLFALLTEGMTATERVEMWNAICERLDNDKIVARAEVYARGVFGG